MSCCGSRNGPVTKYQVQTASGEVLKDGSGRPRTFLTQTEARVALAEAGGSGTIKPTT